MNESPPQGTEPLLTDNQCKALKTRERRAPLLEIPQEEEPVQLSLGIKNGGGTLRLKIPFAPAATTIEIGPTAVPLPPVQLERDSPP